MTPHDNTLWNICSNVATFYFILFGVLVMVTFGTGILAAMAVNIPSIWRGAAEEARKRRAAKAKAKLPPPSCLDCKHFLDHPLYPKCHSPENGRHGASQYWADTSRRHDIPWTCGPKGKWFEPVAPETEKSI